MSHPPRPTGWRRPLLVGALVGLLVVGQGLVGLPDAGAREGSAARRRQVEPTSQQRQRRRAIERACAWLAAQQEDDGSWGAGKARIALTSLSTLALMASGSTDGRGPYGTEVRKGVEYLLKLIENKPRDSEWHEGYFEAALDTTSRMHGQGFATLALASALGTSTASSGSRRVRGRHERIRAVLRKAVACCEAAQTMTGGYGYNPTRSAKHEGSVTVAVAQGLRAARDAGLLIDRKVVRDGLAYLRRSQKADGSFKYSESQDTSTYALTGAALSAFFLFGQYEDKPGEHLVARGIRALRRYLEQRRANHRWYYYGHFYAAWACWQKDGHTWEPLKRNLWGWWQSIVYPDLLGQQMDDGSFEIESQKFTAYRGVLATSFAVLTLAIPDEALPIFQR